MHTLAPIWGGVGVVYSVYGPWSTYTGVYIRHQQAMVDEQPHFQFGGLVGKKGKKRRMKMPPTLAASAFGPLQIAIPRKGVVVA